ncbi:MAG: hypothetical protein KDE20_24290 [Caldilineaceae bacterium]|nr:hypothetical protein [Caldilineaceae bacterium]
MNEQDRAAADASPSLDAPGTLERPIKEAVAASEAWPPDYFPETYGALGHDPLTRAPQGKFEIREPLD